MSPRGGVVGFLYYGSDDDLHGDTGRCDWLATVKAVQSRWIVTATFSIPTARYDEENLLKATGKIAVSVTSNAVSRYVTSEKIAGTLGVSPGAAGVGVDFGASRQQDFSVKLRKDIKRSVPLKLNSSSGSTCAEKERGKKRVYVFCTWTLSLGTFTWRAPSGTTEGGLQTMALNGTLGFPGSRSVTVDGVFEDNP